MTLAERRNEWKTRVAEYKASGQSVTSWCEANGLKVNTMWYWLRKLRSEEVSEKVAGPQWLAVEVGDSIEDSTDTLGVRVGKAILEVKLGFNPALLREVVRTLAAIC